MTGRRVYFIKPIGMEGPVKIGCSREPDKRLYALMTWSPWPLHLAASVNGSFDLEAKLHNCFADHHTHREWFSANPKLTKLIEHLSQGGDIADGIDLSDAKGSIRSKPRGAENWAPHTRAWMSLFQRCRHAAKRNGTTVWRLPKDVDRVLDTAHGRLLTPDELSVVTQYCEQPAPSPSKQEVA